MGARLVALLVFVGALAPTMAGAQEPKAQPLPVLKSVSVEGATIFSREEILRSLELQEGNPLPKPAADLARDLERRYVREGYTYAEVTASFEAATGRLVLRVDEGRFDVIEFEGIEPALARKFEEDFELRPGDIFNRRHATRALSRLLAPARGAFTPSREAVSGTVFTSSRDLERQRRIPFNIVERGGKRTLVINLKKNTGRAGLFFGTEAREDWFSPVDGFAPALGFHTTVFDHEQFNHTYVAGHVSYKFGRDEPGYALGFERPLFGSPKLYVGAEVHDLTASDDFWRLSVTEQSLVALGFKNSFRDYYRRRGYQLTAILRAHPQHEVLAAWRDERHEPVANETTFSLFRDRHVYRPNAAATDAQHHALVFGYAWDSRSFEQEAVAQTFRRHQIDDLYGSRGEQEPGWRIEWSSELASPGALGGDFDFRRHILNARRYTRLSPHQRINARFVAGLSDGALPPQRQFALGGIGSVRGYRFKEAVGERMALLNVEYKLELGRVWFDEPGPAIVAFVDAGRVFRPVAGSHDKWMRGAGFGLEFGTHFRVDFGWRLDDIPQSLQVLVRFRPLF